MSSAREALDDGRLAEALRLQCEAVRLNPCDSAPRLFLFELLTLSGDLAEARTELKRVESEAPNWPASRRAFRDILRAEARRSPRLRRPEFLSDPPPHLRRRWNAALCHAQGQPERALRWLDRADSAVPEVAGYVDGREFHGLRDSDDRFAAHFEIFLGRRCVWVAFEDVKTLRLHKAEHLLDLAFRAATLELADGSSHSAVLPLLYPGSARAGDEFALGDLVDWTSADAGLVCGLGARVLTFGEEEASLAGTTMIELRRA